MRLECPAGDVVARSSGAEQRAAVCYSKEAMTRVEVKVARSGSKRIFANSRQVSRGHPWRTPSYIEISVALLLLRTSSLYIDPTAVEAAVARQQLWNSGTSYGQTHVKPKIQRRGHGEQGTPAFSERRYLKRAGRGRTGRYARAIRGRCKNNCARSVERAKSFADRLA